MLTTESAARKDLSTARHGVELQHRHFSFIAAVIAGFPTIDQPGGIPRKMRETLVERFADACAQSNPRFDRCRFLKACGVS